VFSSGWSVYGLRKVLLGKEVLILSGKNLTVLKLKKKTIILISRLRLMYKRVILNMKRKQNNFFWNFLNIGLVFVHLINLLL
jgi:hypothetical protein